MRLDWYQALPKSRRRKGISLIEVMIGIAITSAVLLIMIQFFNQMSKEIAKGRAIIEMASQGRSIGELLRSDLAAATVKPSVWTEHATPNGYFEIIEGARNDSTSLLTASTDDDYIGDMDDVAAFTARSTSRQYRGRFRGFNAGRFSNTSSVIESELAEIVWFSGFRDLDVDGIPEHDDQVNVYRRALVIRPDLNSNAAFQAIRLDFDPGAGIDEISIFYEYNDISVRWELVAGITFRPVANSLEDLAIRANRFGRYVTAFPNELTLIRLNSLIIPNNTSVAAPRPAILANGFGTDLVLANIGAFDIRVYSPNAVVGTVGNDLVQPGDPGFGGLALTSGEGAYVDLAYASAAAGSTAIWFSEVSASRPVGNAPYVWNRNTWCSWSPSYEKDGIDQDDDGTVIDEATDQLDSNANAIVDDWAERETIPPYPYAIRGIQFTIRSIEKNTGQLRQFQVESSFVPE